MTNFYYQDPEDEDNSTDSEDNDIYFEVDDPIIKGEDDYPDVNC